MDKTSEKSIMVATPFSSSCHSADGLVCVGKLIFYTGKLILESAYMEFSLLCQR